MSTRPGEPQDAAGIPAAAQARLRAARAAGGSFFTSDLSTAEFLLVRQAGFRPITQVMGSCFYNVGWQAYPYAGYGFGNAQIVELDVQSEAWNEARRLALERLAAEATLAGAEAVLGVRITRGQYDWAQGLIEFVAVGTAVSSARYDLGEQVVLSSLSGQEFTSLVRSGWLPVGVVAGSTVIYVVGGYQTVQAVSGYGARWRNTELSELSAGVAAARGVAMRHVVRQAHELGAAGVVALQLDQHQLEREVDQQAGGRRLDLVVTLHTLGTAIVPVENPPEPPPTYIAVQLNEEPR